MGGLLLQWFPAGSRMDHGRLRHFHVVEVSLAADAPRLAFVTTGPGLTNALTGVATVRWEGTRPLLVSACTLWPNNLLTAVQSGRVLSGDLVLGYAVGSVSTATAAVFRVGEVAIGGGVDTRSGRPKHDVP
jgi:hypothetical protein